MKLDRESKIEIVAIVREELEELLKQKAENGSDYRNDKELLERMIRVEEALVHQGKIMEQRFEAVDKRFEAVDKRFEDMHKYMDKRFEAVDKRFEDMHKYMDKRFEAVDKRFQEINANFKWVMGLIVGSAIAIIGILKFV